MRSGAFKSNSEPYPDWLAGNLIFSVIKAASPSPRSLESPRDLLLRAQEGREGRPLSALVTLSPSRPTPHRPLIWVLLLPEGPGIFAQAGRTGAQGRACPGHGAAIPHAVPRKGVSPHGPARGSVLEAPSPLTWLRVSLPSSCFPSSLQWQLRNTWCCLPSKPSH